MTLSEMPIFANKAKFLEISFSAKVLNCPDLVVRPWLLI